MAKKRSGPNKSSAIRDLVDANPSASPSEISAELAKQGIEASPAFVSTIKSQYTRKKQGGGSSGKRRKRRGRPVGSKNSVAPARSTSEGNLSIDSLIQAKELANKLGGIEKARAALDALARLA